MMLFLCKISAHQTVSIGVLLLNRSKIAANPKIRYSIYELAYFRYTSHSWTPPSSTPYAIFLLNAYETWLSVALTWELRLCYLTINLQTIDHFDSWIVFCGVCLRYIPFWSAHKYSLESTQHDTTKPTMSCHLVVSPVFPFEFIFGESTICQCTMSFEHSTNIVCPYTMRSISETQFFQPNRRYSHTICFISLFHCIYLSIFVPKMGFVCHVGALQQFFDCNAFRLAWHLYYSFSD